MYCMYLYTNGLSPGGWEQSHSYMVKLKGRGGEREHVLNTGIQSHDDAVV